MSTSTEHDSRAFYAQLERKFIAWAQDESDVRAAFVVGSRARADHPADEWSDLDIILFVGDPEAYRTRLDWVVALAPVWVTVMGATVNGEPERLVLYAGGYQVDFVLCQQAILAGLPALLSSEEIPDTLRRGVRVLVDKDGQLAQLPPPSATRPKPALGQADLDRLAGHFWFRIVYAAKMLCRGEVALYKTHETALLSQLLTLIGWHAQVTAHDPVDTWHGGRFLREWADPRAHAALEQTCAAFDVDASWAALLAAGRLFRWLMGETTAAGGLASPVEDEAAIMAYLEDLARRHAGGQSKAEADVLTAPCGK